MLFNVVAGLALSLAVPAAGLTLPRNAAPEPVPGKLADLFCDVVEGLVTVAKQQKQATPFCSSYLHIPVVTKTSTVTSFTTTITETDTITSGSTTTTDATVTETTTSTETIATISYYPTITACASPGAVRKRAAAVTIKKPSCFAKYVHGKALSSACKCLSVPTSSTTTTTILSMPTTTTVSVTVPLTVHATATVYSTVVEKKTVYTATSPLIAIPTFTIFTIGGGNNGNAFTADSDGTVRNDGRLPPTLQFTTVNNNVLKVLNGPYAGTTAATDPNVGGEGAKVHFGSTNPNMLDTRCQVTSNGDGTCPLACEAARGTTSFDCGVWWRVGSEADVPPGCSRFVPYAVGGS